MNAFSLFWLRKRAGHDIVIKTGFVADLKLSVNIILCQQGVYMNLNWDNIGIAPADILLPRNEYRDNFCVVACDQFTSDSAYWEETERLVGKSCSSLRLIYPEIYLNDRPEERIETINRTMSEYLEQGIFEEYPEAIIYVERILSDGRVRKGLVLAADLEKYDYSPRSASLIRATEGTIESRLPARIRIRQNAPLELPHIMLLIDDKGKTVIEPLENAGLQPVYDINLMQGGGRVKGYLVDKIRQEEIFKALSGLADMEKYRAKYALKEDAPLLLYAVGDGNHSLASAKSYWESLKKNLSAQEAKKHPARYALVELVNLHDSSLEFEPIHRVLFNVEPEKILKKLDEFCGFADEGQALEIVFDGRSRLVHLARPSHQLAVGTLQKFLDEIMKDCDKAELDYIHEEDTVRSLGALKGNIGFILSPMIKDELFKSVILDGPLPRKTFSMGSGRDKRYYLEARRIKP